MTGGASGHRSDAAWLVGLCLSRFLVALVFTSYAAVLPVLAAGVDTSQFEQVGAALLATVPGADPDRCASRPVFPDPAELTDSLLPIERQREVADAAITAFLEAFVAGDGSARRVLAGDVEESFGSDVEWETRP